MTHPRPRLSTMKREWITKLHLEIDACPYISAREASELRQALRNVFNPPIKTSRKEDSHD